jgi:polyhydroxybutyrate depolymerase
MSNGAMMAYRLASEMADVFAAIAPVAGTMGTEACNPSQGVSVIHFHGSDDEFVPVEGGVGRRSVSGTHHFSLAHTIRAWVEANGCPSQPLTETMPGLRDDSTTIVRSSYGPGRSGTEVVVYLIHGAGHTWPGRPPRPHYLGKTTYNINANDMIWDFFRRHDRHSHKINR